MGVTRWDKIRSVEECIQLEIHKRRLQWLGHIDRMPFQRNQKILLKSNLFAIKDQHVVSTRHYSVNLKQSRIDDLALAQDRKVWTEMLRRLSP